MCGIAGFFSRAGSERAVSNVAAMLRAQAHRGPDGAGIWVKSATTVPVSFASTPSQLSLPAVGNADCVLGHNWLAIQDRHRAASQPMRRGPLTIVFNGEIYNFVELREELLARGDEFTTSGDTEVLLAMWKRHGVACLPRLRGMFAFLLHDGGDGSLWAIRDGLGIKPLYFADTSEGLYFGSEIRSFHSAGLLPRRIREGAALASMAGAAHRFAEFDTLYDGIQELPAGYRLHIGPAGRRIERWFELPPIQADLAGDEHCEFLLDAIHDSIRLHLRSTRRIAACLSGGLDSSVLVSLIDRQSSDCSAFTINSAADSHSEIDLAKQVIAGTGLRHHIFNHQSEIPARDAFEMAVACEVPNHVIGPINQFLLLREIAEKGFAVVLDGHGGDELVSGYSWWFPALIAELRSQGRHDAVREIEAARQRHLPFDAVTTGSYDQIFYNSRAWIRGFSGDGIFGVVPDAVADLPEFRFFIKHDGSWRGFRQRAYSTDTIYYLLRQADRLGMRFGLECRVPFTDAELVRASARLAPELLIRDGYLKYPVRRMNSGIPESVRWCTRKLGFWKTDDARYPWMRETGRSIVLQSETIRRLLPRVEEDWDAARMDQQWRVLQMAVLERCATRGGIDDVLADAVPALL
ncbi:MAG: asparagine synthase (glutamine-hydrolyzing) [Bryobacteraceae bacterium]